MVNRIAVSLAMSLALAAAAALAQPAKPKLVVIVVVDQFRADYLARFRADYKGGLDRMLKKGANFTNAHYEHAPTVTAVGHSIVGTGAMPSVSGIVGNAWVERGDNNKQVTAVCDYDYKLVGAPTPKAGSRCVDADPASPRRLLVTTVADELRNRDADSKTIGISLKARSAILPVGHRANGAFWFDDGTGNFISSTYYGDELPEFVKTFNDRKLPAQYVERKWDGFPRWDFHAKDGQRAYQNLAASPWGNELIEGLAERAIIEEKLGQRTGHTDLLSVSFSSNDYVGHSVGPDAPEVRDMAIRTDQLLGKLFDVIQEKVGIDKTLIVLTADHGAAPAPDAQKERKLPGDYVFADVDDIVKKALNAHFGAADWILPGAAENALYFNYEILKQKKVDLNSVTRIAAEAVLAVPQAHVARAYTREQISLGGRGDFITTAVLNGFFPRRSADLILIYEPFYMPELRGYKTTHYSPYVYDNHVPVVFYGAGVKAATYRMPIAVNDIAPTLAAAIDVEIPSGAYGKVLTQVLAEK